MGRLSHEVGWKYQDVVATLEAKRKVKSEAYYKKAKTLRKVRLETQKEKTVAKRLEGYEKIIQSFGHA